MTSVSAARLSVYIYIYGPCRKSKHTADIRMPDDLVLLQFSPCHGTRPKFKKLTCRMIKKWHLALYYTPLTVILSGTTAGLWPRQKRLGQPTPPCGTTARFCHAPTVYINMIKWLAPQIVNSALRSLAATRDRNETWLQHKGVSKMIIICFRLSMHLSDPLMQPCIAPDTLTQITHVRRNTYQGAA